MTNRVTSTRVPYLPITVEIPENHSIIDFSALVDTGFNSDVVVPESAIADRVPALLHNDVRLADGSRVTVPGYLGNVRVGDTILGPVMVLVMGDEAVIDLNVLTKFRLTIDHDHTLVIEP